MHGGLFIPGINDIDSRNRHLHYWLRYYGLKAGDGLEIVTNGSLVISPAKDHLNRKSGQIQRSHIPDFSGTDSEIKNRYDSGRKR
jgi:hypothetical protein